MDDGGGGSAVEDNLNFNPFAGSGGAGGSVSDGDSGGEDVCSESLEQCTNSCVSDFWDCKGNYNGKGYAHHCKDVKMECKNWCNENC
jgi:hypothetical protein